MLNVQTFSLLKLMATINKSLILIYPNKSNMANVQRIEERILFKTLNISKTVKDFL